MVDAVSLAGATPIARATRTARSTAVRSRFAYVLRRAPGASRRLENVAHRAREGLLRREQIRPGIDSSSAEEHGNGLHVEVTWIDRSELLPGDGRGDGETFARTRRIRQNGSRALRVAQVVDEDLS